VSIREQGVDFAAEQIDPGEEAHDTVALVFVIAPKTAMGAGL
jgi:hypothetical protein